MVTLIENGYETFTDSGGNPLDNGYIFIGQYGLNPLSNPLQAYWDEDLSIPAVSIRTSKGYPVYNGSPRRLYTAGSYSLLVQDRLGRTVYTQLEAYYDPETFGESFEKSAGNILLYNSTVSLSTSEGVSPEEDGGIAVVDSMTASGGVLSANSDVKWPGQRFAILSQSGGVDPTTGLEWVLIPDTNGFSLSGWFKFPVFSGDRWAIAIHDESATITYVYIGTGGVIGVNVEGTDTESVNTFVVDTWYHLKMTVDYSGNVNLYVDGELEVESTVQVADISAYTRVVYGGSGSLGTASKELEGYFCDALYQPYVDTTTTHYDNNIPWVDEDAVISDDGAYFRDIDHGVVAARKIYADGLDVVPAYIGGSGGGEGLPNYLGTGISDWDLDTGVSVALNTTDPLEVDGDMLATFTTVSSGDGFYQDITLNETDLNSLLQLKGYIKLDTASLAELDLKVLNQSETTEFYSATLEDIVTYNPASGIYEFNVIYNTTDEPAVRFKIAANTTVTGTFQFVGWSMGAPFFYTAPSGYDQAGKMYYSAEAPSSGLNEAGDLCFDGSTNHSWADYPDLAEKQTDLENAGLVVDNGDGTFYCPALIYESGDVAVSSWLDLTELVTHNLGYDIDNLDISLKVKPSGSSLYYDLINVVRIIDTSSSADYTRGVIVSSYSSDSENAVIIQSGADGVYYFNSSGNVAVMTTGGYYNIRIARKGAPPNGSYAYLKSQNLRTVDLLAKQTNREDAGCMYYDYEAPTSGKNRMGDLCFDGSTSNAWSEYPELYAVRASLADALDSDDGTNFVLKEIAPTLGWNTVWTGSNTEGTFVANTFGEGVFKVTVGYAASSTTTYTGFIDTNDIGSGGTPSYVASSGILLKGVSDYTALIRAEYVSGSGFQVNYNGSYTDARLFKIEKLESIGYMYLRSKSLATVILGRLQKGEGYDYPKELTASDISTSDANTDLSIYELGGAQEQKVGFTITKRWYGGDATYAHNFDGSGDFYSNAFPEGKTPGDGTTTYYCCGYGTGGLTVRLKADRQSWDIVTDEDFDLCKISDSGNNVNRVVTQYVDQTIEIDGNWENASTAISTTYGTSLYRSAVQTIVFGFTLDSLLSVSTGNTNSNAYAWHTTKDWSTTGANNLTFLDAVSRSGISLGISYHVKGMGRD
jgi:hypothetical protein